METRASLERILCPIGLVNRDDPRASDSSLAALALAAQWVRPAAGTVLAAYVIPEFVMRMTGFEEKEEAGAPGGVRWVPLTGGGFERESPVGIAEVRLREYVDRLVPSGVKAEVIVAIGNPGERLVELADERKVDLVMIPAYRDQERRKPGRIGNVTYHVARNAMSSVWIFR
jgi:nucleotide-binding universal stress UspA family protein